MFAVASTPRALSHRVKLVLIAGFLALSLLVGASATATRVGAQPVGPGLDSFTVACRALQDQEQGLIDQYGQVAGANPNDPQLDDILQQIRNVGSDWRAIGCQGAFGNIVGLQVSAPSRIYRPIGTGVFTLAG